MADTVDMKVLEDTMDIKDITRDMEDTTWDMEETTKDMEAMVDMEVAACFVDFLDTSAFTRTDIEILMQSNFNHLNVFNKI